MEYALIVVVVVIVLLLIGREISCWYFKINKRIELQIQTNELLEKLTTLTPNKPTCIIANTIKGKGLPMIENNPEWHHKFPNEEEYQLIINNLK